jgi:DNA-binding beta-propeller fold protein YncE
MKGSVALFLLSAGFAAAAAGGFHLLREIHIGGAGGWDYVTLDGAGRRLYVSHATKVIVVDPDSGKVVGEIPDTAGVHGIALAPKLNRGFTSNGRANNVTIFDLKTLKAIDRVKTGGNPDAILYEALSNRVFTFNGRSKDATAFDAATGKVDGTIPLGSKPEFAAADGTGRIYVNLEDTSEVAEVDARKLVVLKRYSIKPCDEPSGLALDVKGRRIFSVCANRLMAISDPDSGKVVATLRIGQRPDGAGFDAGTRTAFSSNGDGTLTVVQEVAGKWTVVENAATEPGARTMTVDEKTHAVYLPTAQFGPVPAPTTEVPLPRPAIVPNTFKVLVVGQ